MIRATKKYFLGNGYTDFCHKEKKTDKRRASKNIDKITINFFFYVARNYLFRKQIINNFIFI